MARTDIDNHALFEGFTYSAEQGDGHQDRLALRFTRTPTNFFTPESFVPKAKVPDAMDVVEDEGTYSCAFSFFPFVLKGVSRNKVDCPAQAQV